MTNRERFINQMHFKPVDRILFNPGIPRVPTLKRWHEEGLPEDMYWMDYLIEKLNIPNEMPTRYNGSFDFSMKPRFEEKILSHENGRYVMRDWQGAVVEFSDEFSPYHYTHALDFITRNWHSFPVKTWEDWEDMKKRYDPEDPTRMPEDYENLGVKFAKREWIVAFEVNGPFWQMREWMGFENLCIAFVEQPDLVADMCQFWDKFISRLLEKALSKYPVDLIWFSEDMAYKAHPMIGPDMCREFLLPLYKHWRDICKKYGVSVVGIDSDGYIEDLIPVWIDAGFDFCLPIEVAAHNDIVKFHEQFGHQMAYMGGIDKRCIAEGGKVMEDEVHRVMDPFLKDGGTGIFPGCDHGVPQDISLNNFVEYTRLLAQLTGWL